MAAFASSFLANPFEAQALGQTTDSLGNVFNANGQHIGVVTGSVADVGSQGATVSPTSPASSPAISPTSTPITASDVLSGAAAASGVIPYGGQLPTSNILKVASGQVENIVFIIVGLILIGGAVLAFTYKGATTVIDAASGTVGKASRTAGKAVALGKTAIKAAGAVAGAAA